jgi:hypothetical protein
MTTLPRPGCLSRRAETGNGTRAIACPAVKVWARYAVPVMVLVDENSDEIEKVVLVAGERDIDRARPSMNMLSTPRISS